MICFDSTSTAYKMPFGAVSRGKLVSLRVYVPRQ